ncbi:hypothetical protein WJX73_000664 [Symbiochloris irregularis]|uniref:Uncharacterized protein n=1 Tax=Symbiochloris irregularis TaxID=706552 RepID=A0AAW1PS91_9CHLO
MLTRAEAAGPSEAVGQTHVRVPIGSPRGNTHSSQFEGQQQPRPSESLSRREKRRDRFGRELPTGISFYADRPKPYLARKTKGGKFVIDHWFVTLDEAVNALKAASQQGQGRAGEAAPPENAGHRTLLPEELPVPYSDRLLHDPASTTAALGSAQKLESPPADTAAAVEQSSADLPRRKLALTHRQAATGGQRAPQQLLGSFKRKEPELPMHRIYELSLQSLDIIKNKVLLAALTEAVEAAQLGVDQAKARKAEVDQAFKERMHTEMQWGNDAWFQAISAEKISADKECDAAIQAQQEKLQTAEKQLADQDLGSSQGRSKLALLEDLQKRLTAKVEELKIAEA